MQKGYGLSAQRSEGRLFSKGGRLHMVLETDSATESAKVSCRVGDATEVITMPLVEVMQHLATSSRLKLDKLSANETDERVVQKDEQWFFKAREGEHGPFMSEENAQQALRRHILAAQEEGRTGRPAAAAS